MVDVTANSRYALCFYGPLAYPGLVVKKRQKLKGGKQGLVSQLFLAFNPLRFRWLRNRRVNTGSKISKIWGEGIQNLCFLDFWKPLYINVTKSVQQFVLSFALDLRLSWLLPVMSELILPDFCPIHHGSAPVKHENLPSLEEWFSLLDRHHPTRGTIPESTTGVNEYI